MLGITLALSAAVGFGASTVFARLGMRQMRATTGTVASLLVSTAVTMAVAASIHSEEILRLEGSAYLWFLLAGFLSFPLGRLLNYTGVLLAGVSRSSPIVGAAPLFATALAVIVAGESVNVAILLGIVSVIGGLVLIVSQQ